MRSSCRRLCLSIVAAAALLGGGCASTDFTPSGGQRQIVQGKGGEQVVIDGLTIWDADGPPRKYEVIGRIEDQRASGVLSQLRWQERVVRMAREAGGDALVQLSRGTQFAGYHVLATGAATEAQRGPALGPAPAVPLTRHQASFLVIRYVD